MKTKHNLGLVLSGGGTRGLAHVGALKFFEEKGIEFDVVAGCSIGALIGALYCTGIPPKTIASFVNKINPKDLIDISIARFGLIKGDKISSVVRDFAGVNKFSELKIPLYVNAVDINRRKEKVFSKGDLWKAVRASISLPGIFYPENIGKNYYIDGGVINPLPFDIIDAKKKILIDISNEDMNMKKDINAIKLIMQSIDIMQNEIINEKIKRVPEDDYILLRPNLSGHFILEPKDKLKDVMKKGYDTARRNWNKIKRFLEME